MTYLKDCNRSRICGNPRTVRDSIALWDFTYFDTSVPRRKETTPEEDRIGKITKKPNKKIDLTLLITLYPMLNKTINRWLEAWKTEETPK